MLRVGQHTSLDDIDDDTNLFTPNEYDLQFNIIIPQKNGVDSEQWKKCVNSHEKSMQYLSYALVNLGLPSLDETNHEYSPSHCQ